MDDRTKDDAGSTLRFRLMPDNFLIHVDRNEPERMNITYLNREGADAEMVFRVDGSAVTVDGAVAVGGDVSE